MDFETSLDSKLDGTKLIMAFVVRMETFVDSRISQVIIAK